MTRTDLFLKLSLPACLLWALYFTALQMLWDRGLEAFIYIPLGLGVSLFALGGKWRILSIGSLGAILMTL